MLESVLVLVFPSGHQPHHLLPDYGMTELQVQLCTFAPSVEFCRKASRGEELGRNKLQKAQKPLRLPMTKINLKKHLNLNCTGRFFLLTVVNFPPVLLTI